jgi:hypothetical protein
MVEHTRSILDEEHLPLVVATRQLGPNADQNQEWACPTCTLLNPISFHLCKACSSPIPRYSTEANVNAGGELAIYVAPVLEGNGGTDASENKLAYRQLYSEDLGEDPMAKKRRRRERRRARMVVGGTGGLIVGTIIFGSPAGAILASVGGVTATRVISKRQELKKDERVAQARLAAAHLD